ncbi:MAG: hypothetical protein QXN62_07230 [Candidatus Bathyarchaeia archaeon]|nr:ECF transporter S component [Candidatus Bathyarchaeota archaeon]
MRRSISISGTAVLGALVIVFDLTLWSLRVKIPFPFFPRLRLDISGIPIVLSLLLYGPFSGFATSTILFLSIAFRDPLSGFMRAIAELSTVAGMIPFYTRKSRFGMLMSIVGGVTLRVIVMSLCNMVFLPLLSILTWDAAAALLPFIAGFNVMAGLISCVGGYTLYGALLRRLKPPPREYEAEILQGHLNV